MIDELNEKISEFSANGLIKHILSKYSDEKFMEHRMINNGPLPLTLDNLQGIMEVWIGGLVISFLIFLLEKMFAH